MNIKNKTVYYPFVNDIVVLIAFDEKYANVHKSIYTNFCVLPFTLPNTFKYF